MKLALYSFAGSALVLVGMMAAWVASGGHSMSFDALTGAHFSTHLQMGMFPLVFVGFGVLAGMWPFHTWAPTGHVAAPTAASMLLAGVVMKLGAYGCLRVAMMLFPPGWIRGDSTCWDSDRGAMCLRCWRSSASSTARGWRWCSATSSSSSAIRA